MIFLNEHLDPPCNSSLAMSFVNGMSSEEEEVRRTYPPAESDEFLNQALEIDEEVLERSASLDAPFVVSFDAT